MGRLSVSGGSDQGHKRTSWGLQGRRGLGPPGPLAEGLRCGIRLSMAKYKPLEAWGFQAEAQ
jgi:hypothetical protein